MQQHKIISYKVFKGKQRNGKVALKYCTHSCSTKEKEKTDLPPNWSSPIQTHDKLKLHVEEKGAFFFNSFDFRTANCPQSKDLISK